MNSYDKNANSLSPFKPVISFTHLNAMIGARTSSALQLPDYLLAWEGLVWMKCVLGS